ncbi:MAG: oligopeptidase A, partial [Burkholderiales bacterium]
MPNPLLDFSGLPRFSGIKAEHVGPAMDQLLAAARAAMHAAERAPATWEDFVRPLEDATECLSRAWGQIEHLHAVLDSPPLREAYNASLPKITQFWTELGQNQQLFEKYRELKAAPEFAQLAPARRKMVENALRDFRLGGAELPAELKPRYAAIQEELASLSAKFSENVLDATNAWSIVIEDEKRVAGIPADALQSARETAEKEGKKGWKFNLQMPSYIPVMQYADDRALRATLYRESATRASEFGKP